MRKEHSTLHWRKERQARDPSTRWLITYPQASRKYWIARNPKRAEQARQFREEEEQRLREERQLAIVEALGSARADETAERKEERVTECAKRVGSWKAKMTLRKWST